MPLLPTPHADPLPNIPKESKHPAAIAGLIEYLGEAIKDHLDELLDDYVVISKDPDMYSSISMRRQRGAIEPEIAMVLERFDGGLSRVFETIPGFAENISSHYLDRHGDADDDGDLCYHEHFWDDMQDLIDALQSKLEECKKLVPSWEEYRDEARAKTTPPQP